jgi:hypothetical protein
MRAFSRKRGLRFFDTGLDDTGFAPVSRQQLVGRPRPVEVLPLASGHQIGQEEIAKQSTDTDLDCIGRSIANGSDLDPEKAQPLPDVGQMVLIARQPVQRLDDQGGVLAISECVNGFYNPRRRHSALGWKSPLAFERKAA